MRLIVDTNSLERESEQIVIISPERGDNIYDLDKFVDHNSCELVSFALTDYIPTNKLVDYVNALSNKLAHKGQLLITGTDALEVSSAFATGKLNSIDFNTLVYGTRDKVWAFKQSLVSLKDIVDIMKVNRLKIIQKRLSDFTYSVVGERE